MGGGDVRPCKYCDEHFDIKGSLIEGGVTMKGLKWMFGGICILAIAILGFLVTITGDVGELRAEMGKAIAVETAKVEAMQKQVDHVAAIQQTVTKYIMERQVEGSNKPSINVYPHRDGNKVQ